MEILSLFKKYGILALIDWRGAYILEDALSPIHCERASKMDLLEVVRDFWPVILPFIGGCILRNARNRLVGVACLVALTIVATWIMGQGDLTRPVVLGSLVAGGILGLVADFEAFMGPRPVTESKSRQGETGPGP